MIAGLRGGEELLKVGDAAAVAEIRSVDADDHDRSAWAKASTWAPTTSRPPRSRARRAASPCTRWIEARFFVDVPQIKPGVAPNAHLQEHLAAFLDTTWPFGPPRPRLYYDKFGNSLYSYDNLTYSTMLTRRAFRSEYDDHSTGGSHKLLGYWSVEPGAGAGILVDVLDLVAGEEEQQRRPVRPGQQREQLERGLHGRRL